MKVKLLLIVSILVVVLALLVFNSGFFTITSLKIEGDIFCLNLENFEKEVGVYGENIFLFDPLKVSDQLIRKYPCLKKVDIKKELPSKLRVNLTERKPFLKVSSYTSSNTLLSLVELEATSSSQAALLDWSYVPNADFMISDEAGVIFQEGGERDLPKLLLQNQEIKMGKQLDQVLFKKLEEVVKKITPYETKMKVLAHSLLVETDLDGNSSTDKIAFSLQKDLSSQLASLQLILQKTKIDGRVMEIVDLRFDKPVVRYINLKK